MMKHCFFLFCLITNIYLSAQQNVDSLIRLVNTSKEDTVKLDLYLILVEVHPDENEWKKYNEMAFSLATKLANAKDEKISRKGKQGLASAYNNKGYIEINKGNSLDALDFFEKAYALKKSIQDSSGLAGIYSNLGAALDKMGKVEKALDYYLKALNLKETQKNPDLKGTILGNIGSVYNTLKKFQKARDYFLEDIELKSKNNTAGLGAAYSNIAPIYRNLKNYPDAFKYAYKALAFAKKTKDTFLENEAYSRLADFYATSKQYDSALYYSQKSIDLSKKTGNISTMAAEYNNIGYINIKKRKYKEAEMFLLRSYRIYDSLNIFYEIKGTADLLSDVYDSIKEYKKALFYYKISSKIKDNLFKNENREALIKLGMQMEFDKKEAVLKEEQDKERIIAKEKNQQQKIIIWSVIGGLSLVILFSFFIFNRLQITRKQKILIEKQKNETEAQKNIIAEQKRLVDEKQKEVIDSIHYAKRIQQSLLPTEKYIERIFKQF